MTTYAIGDIQGCYDELCTLLERINYDPAADQLWFAGDLVNRGPKSLETLRLIHSLWLAQPKKVHSVLGNHDLHLLAVASGATKPKNSDTLADILAAPDRDSLLAWLQQRPLIKRSKKLGWSIVHAGIPAQWSLEEARQQAKLVHKALRGPDANNLFQNMYGNKPDLWSKKLSGWPQMRFIINGFTRMRYCNSKGQLFNRYSGPPGSQPNKLVPWYLVPGRKTENDRILFGHWSTLGLKARNNCYSLDTGCLWGGQLTAFALETETYTAINCIGYKTPGN